MSKENFNFLMAEMGEPVGDDARIQKILSNEKIRSASEFRFILQIVKEIVADASKTEFAKRSETKPLNALLADYEQKK